ncbi:MAG: hypothetical protein KF822_12685 [Steroidobacteraceae bacterium]|nr:hypothetical protein [Steroidobacteraceae bacterium]
MATDHEPVTYAALRTLVEGLTEELAGKFGAIERRLAELESRQVRYVGVYESGRRYRKGELVTHDGSVWHCEAATEAKPGTTDAWVLAVKRGKDAR